MQVSHKLLLNSHVLLLNSHLELTVGEEELLWRMEMAMPCRDARACLDTHRDGRARLATHGPG